MSQPTKKWLLGLAVALLVAAAAYVSGGCFLGNFWESGRTPGISQQQTTTVNQGSTGSTSHVDTLPTR